jgi:hypothetical protein
MAARTLLPFLLCSLVPLVGAGCAKGDSDADSTNQDIINGAAATEYPEAATIDFQKGGLPFICSGSIIAPRVALTAGHCVAGANSWFVHAGQFRVSASTATVLDYTDQTENVNFGEHDIGLVFLDDPIILPRYPLIASTPLPNGSTVFNVGRILNGAMTDSLFGRSSVVSDAAPLGGPLDYSSSLVIQPGDSGGPDFAFGTHTIVSVNSGAQATNDLQFLARVDLVHDFIQQEIALHGGGGAESPIPDGTLRSVNLYEVTATQLNCRSAPGTASPIEQTLFQGQVVQATETPSRPRVAFASDGNPWVLVQPPAGGACYVSANFKFLNPLADTPPPPPPEPPITPLPLATGLYGSLAVVVHNGMLTGAVGEGACSFTVTGPIPNVNPIQLDLITPDGKKPAQLEFVNATTLSFRTTNLPSSCIGVFDPTELASGTTLVLRANLSTDLMAFRTVQADKAFFHDLPNSPARASFVIRGQTVRQIGVATDGFALVTFTNPQGVKTQGFLAETDLVSLGLFSADL